MRACLPEVRDGVEPLNISWQRLCRVDPPGRPVEHLAAQIARETGLHDCALADQEGDLTLVPDGQQRPCEPLEDALTQSATRQLAQAPAAAQRLDALPQPLLGGRLVITQRVGETIL